MDEKSDNSYGKQAGLNCMNSKCLFWDKRFDQNCGACDDFENPFIVNCVNYNPLGIKK